MSDDQLNYSSRSWFPRVAACLVGVYLLTAAGLKLFSGGATSLNEGAYPPALEFLAVQTEIVLGAWLILGWWRTSAWISACLLLTALATLSVVSVLRGQSDCGCFGNLKVHPGITASVNLVALGLLVAFRPAVKWTENRGSFVVVGLLVSLVGVLAWVATGPSGEKLLAKWQGRTVALQSSVVDAGEELEGTVKRLSVTVTNCSSRDVRIIGGSADCSCTTLQSLPVTAPANGELAVEVEFKFRGTPGQFEHRFEFFTDDKTQPKLTGVIVGRVADSPP